MLQLRGHVVHSFPKTISSPGFSFVAPLEAKISHLHHSVHHFLSLLFSELPPNDFTYKKGMIVYILTYLCIDLHETFQFTLLFKGSIQMI